MKFIFLLLLPITLLSQTPTSELPYKDQPISKKIQHHKRWLNTSDNLKGKQLDVDKEDLTGVDFSGIDLSKAKFKNCILKFAMFSNTNLSLTEFVDCDLSNADLSNTILNDSKFIRCTMNGSSFKNSEIKRATFTAKQNVVDTSYVNFENTKVHSVEFGHINFKNFSLQGANFFNNKFFTCQFPNKDFRVFERFERTLFDKCILDNSTAIGVKFGEIKFISSNARDVDFTKAEFIRCIILNQSDFSGSKFIEANLRGSYFRNSRFRRCGFSKTNLDDSEIRVCDFESAVIQEPIARNTDFSGSNFYAGYLNFSDVHSKANFTGCTWSNGNQCDTESFGYCKQVVDNN
ncbi:pentapeptide repeat-containing protein [Aquimarina mytili]|uniref:Pentapeptide repeat-containing protein n=1 Tax=Aquimarina mytili TaxID=874423 RepID=A0A936ZXC1_9FLAO|nr:pentapeptide repeat-containing protein [Aquimarina mytili]MBL0686032.1 pentapeptide repeat-containing protein [Aquimarina mytili]